MHSMSAPRPRRVTFLITTIQVGGAEMQLLRISRELTRRGWSVTVLVLRGGPGLDAEFRDVGVEVKHLTSSPTERPGIGAVLGLARELRGERPDCLVTMLFQANVLGKVVGAVHRVPVISSIRNVRFGGGSRMGGLVADALERLTRPFAHATVVNSELAARELADRMVVDPGSVRVIVNALPEPGQTSTTSETGALREELGLPAEMNDGEFIWLAAGRLERQKNYGRLLEAFALVLQDFPAARLVIAGEGSERPTMEAQIDSLAIGNAVKLLGLRRDLPRLMEWADAFVLASRWEGLPNVVLEAMSAGLPTVATDVGGVADLIRHGETGWLLSSPEAADLAGGMKELMSTNESDRMRVAHNGQRFVRESFGLQAVTDKWEELLSEASTVGRLPVR